MKSNRRIFLYGIALVIVSAAMAFAAGCSKKSTAASNNVAGTANAAKF